MKKLYWRFIMKTFKKQIKEELKDEKFSQLFNEERELLSLSIKILEERNKLGISQKDLAKKARSSGGFCAPDLSAAVGERKGSIWTFVLTKRRKRGNRPPRGCIRPIKTATRKKRRVRPARKREEERRTSRMSGSTSRR